MYSHLGLDQRRCPSHLLPVAVLQFANLQLHHKIYNRLPQTGALMLDIRPIT